MFTLSSKKNINIPLPQHFVRKIFGVDVTLDKKNKITRDDVLNWWKYRKIRNEVTSVQDLIRADKFFEERMQKKMYALWSKYGEEIAKHVQEIKSEIDTRNIPLILGKFRVESDSVELLF